MTRNIFTLRKPHPHPTPSPHTHFHMGKTGLSIFPWFLLCFYSSRVKVPGATTEIECTPQRHGHIPPTSFRQLYLMNFEWIPSSTVQPTSFIKERHHNPWTRDGFHQGQLAAGYTWQERQRMPVDDGIHNMVAILLFQTLLRHSVRTGFQRAGVHSPPVSFQNISGTREREQSVLTSIWNYFILASGDLNTRHVFPCPMAVFTMNMTSKQICSATEENNQSCIQIQERSITKSTQCKEKSGFFPLQRSD